MDSYYLHIKYYVDRKIRMSNDTFKPNKLIILIEVVIVLYMIIVSLRIKQYNEKLIINYLEKSTVLEQTINIINDEKYFYYLTLGLISMFIFIFFSYFLIKYASVIGKFIILIINIFTLIVFLIVFWDPILFTATIGTIVTAGFIYINQD